MANKSYLKDIPQDRILYSNCWEDADLLLAALDPQPSDVILSIGSAGDNSFSLLSRGPEKIWICDVSQAQIKLIQLKKAAIQYLNYDELLYFLGIRENGAGRLSLFNSHLAKHLEATVLKFWEARPEIIEEGVIHAGRLENYFEKYRKYLQPLIAPRKTLDRFFIGPRTPADIQFFNKKVRNPIFRGLLRFFLSSPMLKLMGRTPSFFNEVKMSVSGFLLGQFTHFVNNPESYNNHYMHFIARGYFNERLPHYLRPEIVPKVKANLDRLHFIEGPIHFALKADRGITLINASDIFEYMPKAIFHQFADRLKVEVPNLRRIAYWNLMVDRVLSEDFPADFEQKTESLPEDKVFFYQRFIVESRKILND